MSSRTPLTALKIAVDTLPHTKFTTLSGQIPLRYSPPCIHHRTFTKSSCARIEADIDPRDRPRWQRTPPAMAVPVRIRESSARTEGWKVNDDPRLLDDFYNRALGNGGDKVLPEELKWLAVTHKSFDHGRRGFNDRLAFLGRRIFELQAHIALLNSPTPHQHLESLQRPDEYGRVPFHHPALEGLEKVPPYATRSLVDKARLARLAERYGLPGVLRWSPKNMWNLRGSGVDTVLAHAMYAVVGAVALQKGGEVANRTVRERILSPLGAP